MIIAAAVLLVVGVLIYTLAIRPQDLSEAAPASPTEYLEERKAAITENLQDLQFEFGVGKLSETDYQVTRRELQQELDEVERAGIGVEPAPPAAKPAAAPGTLCPHCGARFPQPLKFCGECGKPMTGGAA
jgi:hypothetical protein